MSYALMTVNHPLRVSLRSGTKGKNHKWRKFNMEINALGSLKLNIT
jgi:hypothetical protein